MIKIENLCKTYPGGNVKAVDSLSFEVGDGEIVGFIGKNGAGKTTTIKMLTGIIRPDSGNVTISNMDVVKDSMKIKKITGYISDNPDMYLKLTGLEFIHFIADIYEVPEADRKERIEKFAKEFDIEGSLGMRMSEYSHGMRQKTMVVAALVHDPEVWILDEPMVGLDPEAAYKLKGMMRDHAKKGNSVLFSTHVLEVAEKLCDKVVIIDHGKKVFFGTLDELKEKYTDRTLEEIFMQIVGEREE